MHATETSLQIAVLRFHQGGDQSTTIINWCVYGPVVTAVVINNVFFVFIDRVDVVCLFIYDNLAETLLLII